MISARWRPQTRSRASEISPTVALAAARAELRGAHGGLVHQVQATAGHVSVVYDATVVDDPELVRGAGQVAALAIDHDRRRLGTGDGHPRAEAAQDAPGHRDAVAAGRDRGQPPLTALAIPSRFSAVEK